MRINRNFTTLLIGTFLTGATILMHNGWGQDTESTPRSQPESTPLPSLGDLKKQLKRNYRFQKKYNKRLKRANIDLKKYQEKLEVIRAEMQAIEDNLYPLRVRYYVALQQSLNEDGTKSSGGEEDKEDPELLDEEIQAQKVILKNWKQKESKIKQTTKKELVHISQLKSQLKAFKSIEQQLVTDIQRVQIQKNLAAKSKKG